ncbi:MAG: UDP-N-acetylmuramoyl-L-alanine--D-glutamate ligase [candidate division WOR-3 bacterium]
MKTKKNQEIFANKKITILGCGKSGLECAIALKKSGAFPFVSDSSFISSEHKEILLKEQIPFEENGHTSKALETDLIVVSPGVKPHAPILEEAKKQNKEIIGELEVGYELTAGKYIAITGTNGKSTVTTLTYELLKNNSPDTFICGNIGDPLSMYAFKEGNFVLEVSSFQLKTIKNFKPDIAVILNIDQDHLDWHLTFDDYVNSKSRIFENQDENDYLILNYDDVIVKNLARRSRSKILWVSIREEVQQGSFLDRESGLMVIKLEGRKFPLIKPEELLIKGIHNVFNAAVASLIAYLNGLEIKDIRETLKSFRGLPHRVEFVLEKNGVKFYDDSKGTNPHAVYWALEGFSEPVILIMGGEDKDLDFHPLRESVKKHCKTIVAIGKAKPKVIETFSDITEVIPAEDMRHAVELAWSKASKGDVILLSPGCASFDMFKNYKERGDVYQYYVRKIAEEG